MANFGIAGYVGRRLANSPANPDSSNPSVARTDARGEQWVENLYNGLQGAADEGSYITYTNEGTRGTGVNLTSGTGTSYAATQALCVIYNGASNVDVIPDYLTIKIDTAITGGTFWNIYHALDQGNRYASGGTVMTGIANNYQGAIPSGITAATGVVTASAAVNAKDVGYNLILNGIGVAGAVITIKFGCQENPAGVFTTPSTAVAQSTFYAPPIVIPPGYSYVMNEFQASRSATGVGEFFLGCMIR